MSNKVIINNLKKILEGSKGKWADELPWADRTTPKIAKGQSPLSQVHGCEAVIPSEIMLPTTCYGKMTPEQND